MPLTNAALGLGEHIDIDRFQLALGVRSGDGGDEGIRLDVVKAEFLERARRHALRHGDRDGRAFPRDDLQSLAAEFSDAAAHPHGRGLSVCGGEWSDGEQQRGRYDQPSCE